VVERVLRKHGLEGPDFEFRLERTYPAREIITQWQETDLQFIQRILSEVGIYWRSMMDDVRGLDTYIFADSQLNYQFDVRLPYSEPSGLFDGAAESVWDVRTWHNIATGTVVTRDYNYRTATTPMDAAVSVRSDAVTTGSITATRHLIVKRAMTPARSRKPNLARSTPDFTTNGSSTGRHAFTCSAMLHTLLPGRCWSRRAMSLRPCKKA
jgi:uncharacterized protein involved in type VI secretion and phage assembly